MGQTDYFALFLPGRLTPQRRWGRFFAAAKLGRNARPAAANETAGAVLVTPTGQGNVLGVRHHAAV
jgi:hypothetical protein